MTFVVLAAMSYGARNANAQEPNARPSNNNASQTDISVREGGGIELHLADVPLPTVLRLLSTKTQRNIVTSPNVKGTVTAHLYGVTFEEALEAVLFPNSAGYRVVGNFIQVYTNEELTRMSESKGPPVTRVLHLNYLSASAAKELITPLLTEGESVSMSPLPDTGISSGAAAAGGNSHAAQDFVIVTASAERAAQIQNVLRQVDVRPRQVLIEATILRAQLNDDNALGIDFSIVGGVDLEELGSTSTGIGNITLGELPQDRLERFNAAGTSGFTADVPDGGLRIGIIKDKVAVFLQALEQVTDTTVLANPKVLALNKQKGQVIVGKRDGFLTTTVTETQAVQSVEFLETGTQLIFRPFIGDDGYVRVELHPEDSVGFVNAQGLPSEQTTEVTTNVIVRDGQTILIGGLFREVSTAARKQVPGVGNIPGLGALFRSNNDSVTREEVIILLTIHVVKDQDAYARDSRTQLEDIERIRIGTRLGLMWHGRDRLAHTHYQKATDALHRGDVSRAIWHNDLSLNNNPRYIPAIQLRERLLEDRFWEREASAGRGFIHRVIAEEKGFLDPLHGYSDSPDEYSPMPAEKKSNEEASHEDHESP